MLILAVRLSVRSAGDGKNGRKDSTAAWASTADVAVEAHHCEKALEYVIGKEKRGPLVVLGVACAGAGCGGIV